MIRAKPAFPPAISGRFGLAAFRDNENALARGATALPPAFQIPALPFLGRMIPPHRCGAPIRLSKMGTAP